MLLNSFAPPFLLVAIYFGVGLGFLSVAGWLYFSADFTAILSFKTAAFFHAFFGGFVMSVIIGALYQLSSVILERPFGSMRGAFLGVIIFGLGFAGFVAGLFAQNLEILSLFGGLLAFYFCYFCLVFGLTFKNGFKKSFAKICLAISPIFLFLGALCGFLLVLIFNNALNLSFETVLKWHLWFIFGFVLCVMSSAASVLLPMFSLAHGLKFYGFKIGLISYFISGIFLQISLNLAIFLGALGVLFFGEELINILMKKARAIDIWGLNVIFASIYIAVAIFFAITHHFELGILWASFGFFHSFIAAHLYKIVPFLVWYHFISPFVGKCRKLPKMGELFNNNLAFKAFGLNLAGLFIMSFGRILELEMVSILGLNLIFLSIILLIINIFKILKFMKFKGEKNE